MIATTLLFGCDPLGPWPDTAGPDDTTVARFAASPARLDFGTISVNEDGAAEATFTLLNLGDAREALTGQNEPIGSAAFLTDAEPLVALDPGDELVVTVRFAPTTEGEHHAEILVQDGYEAEVVALDGISTAPVLEIGSPSFSATVLGCTSEGTVAIRNLGSEPLVLAGASASSEEFAVTSWPEALEPDTEDVVTLSFTPAGGGMRGATLLVESNDPLLPSRSAALSVLGYEGERVSESFRYTPSNPTDILFVVDTAGGMTAQLDKAAYAIPVYVDEIRSANLDYQVTALSGGDACPASSPGFATRSDTSLQTESILERGFSGDAGAWDEDLLGLALAALDAAQPGGCLEDFRRSEADLQLVVVSDGPSVGDVEAQVDSIQELIGDASLRLDALLPGSGWCGEDAVDYRVAVESSGGTVEDLCASDWTDAFTAFATLPEGSEAVRYELAEPAVGATIEVLVEGSEWTAWTWDEANNAVVFDAGTVPALGAEVALSYVSVVACE